MVGEIIKDTLFSVSRSAGELGMGPRILGRRGFLRQTRDTSVLLLLAASLPAGAACTPRVDLRKNTGTWTQDEVEKAAQSMMVDDKFRFVYRAGKMLLGNQRGENSISSVSKLFSDTPKIIVETHKGLLPQQEGLTEGIEGDAPADSLIYHNEPFYGFMLKGKPGTADEQFLGSDSLRLEKIRISKQHMDGKSDFMFKLVLAKEIQNINAFEAATNVLFFEVYKDYEVPADDVMKKAMRTASINREVNGVPMSAIGDIWAHFAVLPDYLLANDRKMFTQEDKKLLWLFELSAEVLGDMGALEKRNDGTYGWTGSQMDMMTTWYNAADTGYKILFQKPKP